jgi:hypothetical protein
VYRRSAAGRTQLREHFERQTCTVQIVPRDDGIGHNHEYWIIGNELGDQKCKAVLEQLKR